MICCCQHASGGYTVDIPGCSCTTIPISLDMISADETCNYRMYQSCTIQYGPTPACYAGLGLGANGFFSTSTFPDILAGNAAFQYFLTCQYNQILLSRCYCESPYGSPFRDSVLYTWLLGGCGNVCSGEDTCPYLSPDGSPDPHYPNPNYGHVGFALTNGNSFPGSDASCNVKIYG